MDGSDRSDESERADQSEGSGRSEPSGSSEWPGGSNEAPDSTDRSPLSTLAGAVVRADGRVDDFVFSTCTVGGLDATEAVVDCWRRLDRPDVRYVFCAGVALSWYNVLDLVRVHEATDRPVLAVSFEDSEGLEPAIEAAFEGEERAERLATYRSLPPRRRVSLDRTDLFVRSLGLDADETDRVLEAFTFDERPEPLRVAKRAARGADEFRRGAGRF